MFYERREVIEKPSQLNVVERGAVGRLGRILVPWGYWGEDMLIRLAMLRQDSSAMALTYTEIMSLSRDSLSHVLLDFPEEQMRFRKAAALMALFAVTKIYRVELSEKPEERDQHNRWIHDVFETARKVSLEEISVSKADRIMEQLRSSDPWTERMLEEEQSSGPLGELALTSEQKIDYMVKELYLSSSQPSKGPSRTPSKEHAEQQQVNQRLERIEQQLERLISSSSGNCWRCKGLTAPDDIDNVFRPPVAESWKARHEAAQVDVQYGQGPAEHPLRMPRGDVAGLPDCCTIAGSGVPQRLQKRPTPLRSRSKSPEPGLEQGRREQGPPLVSRV